MIKSDSLFDEILELLASTPTPAQLLHFRPSEVLQQRASDLLEKNREGTLTAEEQAELDEFSRMNHFMSMLKIRARKKLSEV